MSDELKPCPFCGGNSIKVDQWATWYCRCENCGSEQISTTKEGAITAWNTRAQGPGPGEAVARDAAFIIEQASLSMTGQTSRLNAIIAAAERILAATPTREG